jgi:hypothetical protein
VTSLNQHAANVSKHPETVLMENSLFSVARRLPRRQIAYGKVLPISEDSRPIGLERTLPG